MKKNFWIALYTSNAKKERHSDLDTKVLTIVFKLPTTHKKLILTYVLMLNYNILKKKIQRMYGKLKVHISEFHFINPFTNQKMGFQ